ncbi:MAG: hypothetical protein Q8Q48_03215 [Candidatus Staskawiczbacteria bacterium]|nr:hypothetical protein [Candidatus Staskawiczbacteria bacterium]
MPLYLLFQYQNDYRNIDIVQKIVFTVLLFGSGSLVYLNNRTRKDSREAKWLWIIFEIIGVIGFIYSVLSWWLIFAFRNGIGF